MGRCYHFRKKSTPKSNDAKYKVILESTVVWVKHRSCSELWAPKTIEYIAERVFYNQLVFRIVVLESFTCRPPGLLSWISPGILSGRSRVQIPAGITPGFLNN